MLKCFYCKCLSILKKMPETRELALNNELQLTVITEAGLSSAVCNSKMIILGYSTIRPDSNKGRAEGVLLY